MQGGFNRIPQIATLHAISNYLGYIIIAELVANDSIIKTVYISIPTGGWFLFVKDPTAGRVPQYIKPTETIINDGVPALCKDDLEAKSN